VPIWSAHEYLHHHVARTIVGEVDRIATELTDIAGRTYANLRPFLDDPLPPRASNSELEQVRARDALNELQRLADTARRWKQDYKEHAAEVLSFINANVPDKTDVFKYMSGIETLSAGRFNGRLPPGFQDRGKKERAKAHVADDPNSEILGHNRWGDLIFWKEILDHAQVTGTKAIIILTNDRKNDWQLGGRGGEGIELDLLKLRPNWKPVPCAHPMLTLEARLSAGVENVVLLDPPYLGALLRTIAGDSAKAFVDVAIVPDPPQGSSETIRRRRLIEEVIKRSESDKGESASTGSLRFPDGPLMASSPSAFVRGLYYSRGPLPAGEPIDSLLSDIQGAVNEGTSIADLLIKDRLEVLDNSMLTLIGRELHDRGVTGSPGYDEALTDLVSTLGELPPFTAASLYLGLIASMYLERASNQPLVPPRSPIAGLLFQRQGAVYAGPAIMTLQKRFVGIERRPLYLLNPTKPSIEVHLDIVPDTYGEVILGSLRISGEEVFTRAQADSTLRLSTYFEEGLEASGLQLVTRACELFSVPLDQVQPNDDFDRIFKFDPTAGFKRLDSVYLDKEEAAE
jgi:hypothetical protein